MRHTISVLVENEFGVLARVAGLFSGRGFNIESLSVAETLDPTVSRITLVTRGDDPVLEQITKQLNKLISVIQVTDFTDTEHVERELVLIKVTADEQTRGELMNIVDIFRGKIIDVVAAVVHHRGHRIRGQDQRADRAARSRSASTRSCAPVGSRCSAARGTLTVRRARTRSEQVA